MALCITDIKQVLEFFGFSLSLLRGVVVDKNCNVNDDNKKYKEEEEKKNKRKRHRNYGVFIKILYGFIRQAHGVL